MTNDSKLLEKVLSKIEPLMVELDQITGKDHSLLTAENIQAIRAEARAEGYKEGRVSLENELKVWTNNSFDKKRLVTIYEKHVYDAAQADLFKELARKRLNREMQETHDWLKGV